MCARAPEMVTVRAMMYGTCVSRVPPCAVARVAAAWGCRVWRTLQRGGGGGGRVSVCARACVCVCDRYSVRESVCAHTVGATHKLCRCGRGVAARTAPVLYELARRRGGRTGAARACGGGGGGVSRCVGTAIHVWHDVLGVGIGDDCLCDF